MIRFMHRVHHTPWLDFEVCFDESVKGLISLQIFRWADVDGAPFGTKSDNSFMDDATSLDEMKGFWVSFETEKTWW